MVISTAILFYRRRPGKSGHFDNQDTWTLLVSQRPCYAGSRNKLITEETKIKILDISTACNTDQISYNVIHIIFMT